MPAVQVFYEGKVQGVGFRATVKSLASGYDVRGWVRNLPDGRVEMLAAAEEGAELEAFLEAIAESSLKGHIRRVERHAVETPADLKGFRIAL